MIVTCRDLAQRFTELEEGASSAVERASLKLHLSICARCRRYVAELASLRALLADLGTDTIALEAPAASVARAIASLRSFDPSAPLLDDD